jgi:hypothetical protein
MQVDDELEVVVRRPGNGFVQIFYLTSYVRLSWTDRKCPVTDGEPNMVQAIE